MTVSANPIMSIGLQHLPSPSDPMGSHLQCSTLPLNIFSKTTENASGAKSKAIQEAGKISAAIQNTPQTPSEQTLHRHHFVDTFLLSKMKQDQESMAIIMSPTSGEKNLPPLISISLSSDTVMEDQTLLWLHLLLGIVHSSYWEEGTLISQEWGLCPNQASTLTTVLLKDIQGSHNIITVTKVHILSIY